MVPITLPRMPSARLSRAGRPLAAPLVHVERYSTLDVLCVPGNNWSRSGGDPLTNALSGSAAVVGLGISDVGRVYGKTGPEFAADAVLNAVADAGLSLSDIDGVVM